MRGYFPLIVSFVVLVRASLAAYCSGSPDAGIRTNELPIYESELTFVRSVKNAKLYMAGPPDAQFPVVHVYGTPYEVGYAQGELMKKDVIAFVESVWSYLVNAAVSEMGDMLSPAAQKLVVTKGFDRALDWCAEVTAPYTPQAYFDELRGLSDATGVSYEMLLRLNMFPELTKASCSFFGAWGAATAGSDGHTYQLRALDYDTEGPFKDFPQVTVYHPSNGGHAYAQVGWPGSIGVLTGLSDQQIAISEIGVSFPDDSFGQGTENTPPEKVRGKPWMFVVRDALQYSESIDEAIERIQGDNRTCNLIIGVGDGDKGVVNGLEYSGYVLQPYDDETLLPVNDTWHFKIDDVVYNGMDWLCPTYTGALGTQLQEYHGKIDETTTIKNILPTVQTGNLHIAVTDLTASQWYLSFCRKSTASTTEPQYAYERQFTKIDMAAVLAEPAPVVL